MIRVRIDEPDRNSQALIQPYRYLSAGIEHGMTHHTGTVSPSSGGHTNDLCLKDLESIDQVDISFLLTIFWSSISAVGRVRVEST